MAIHRIKTQSRYDVPWNVQRVTSYTLSYKATNISAEEVIRDEIGSPFVFPGNELADTCVTNELPSVIEAQVVKLTVESFASYPSLRWELYGQSIVVDSGGSNV